MACRRQSDRRRERERESRRVVIVRAVLMQDINSIRRFEAKQRKRKGSRALLLLHIIYVSWRSTIADGRKEEEEEEEEDGVTKKAPVEWEV